MNQNRTQNQSAELEAKPGYLPRRMVPIRTLTNSAKEVASFLVVYSLLISRVALVMHNLFGAILLFSSVGYSLSTVILLTLVQLTESDVFEESQHRH